MPPAQLERSAVAGEGRPKSDFRADIQGLRAVAVISVILDHVFAWPTGGFLGVDVFFVISGFIITSLLLRQVERRGRISFLDFYRKRVKRIVPAATLVLTVTVAAGYILFNSSTAGAVLVDAVAASLFVANWRFATTDTDYWAAEGTSPVQHYWSLGVEEQYYLVWPVLLALGVAAAATSRGRRLLLALLISAVLAASFLWAVHDTAVNSSWAYFSTLSRAWELGVGAAIAIASPLLVKLPQVIRPWMAWVGLLAVLGGFLTLSSSSPIPAPGALLPVAGTALVIAAGTGGSQEWLWPITNRLARYVGDISYSLYLWHFPVVVLLAPVLEDQLQYRVVVVLLTAMLAVFGYHLVEDPIRRSGWLEPRAVKREMRERRAVERPSAPSRKGVHVAAAAIACSVVVAGTVLLWPTDGPGAPVAAAGTEPKADATGAGEVLVGPEADLAAGISDALQATSWPDLQPSVEDLLTEGGLEEDRYGCGRTVVADPNSCNFPREGATRDAVVLGDSTGIALLPLVREALGADYDVRGLTMAGCVHLDIEIRMDSQDLAEQCELHKRDATAEINATGPDVVFLTNMYGYINALASEEPAASAGDDWEEATTALIEDLRPSGARIVIVGSPPLGKPLVECKTNFSSPSDCVATTTEDLGIVTSAYQRAAASTQAGFIDTRRWFCSAEGACPSFWGSTPVKRDAVHTTPQYSRLLVPVFLQRWTEILETP